MSKIELPSEPTATELRADRADLFREAHALLGSLEMADAKPTAYDVVQVARFLEETEVLEA
jgi:hypothetical protein